MPVVEKSLRPCPEPKSTISGWTLNNDGVLILSEFLRDDQRQYDGRGCFVSKIGIRMKHFYESEISSMLHGWNIIHFESIKTEAIGRSVVPAVYVIANSSHNHICTGCQTAGACENHDENIKKQERIL